ncbi:MAG: glycosyltransferase family 9 protein [Alphaproteobacteria bacterium]
MSEVGPPRRRILVIKLGALGDFIQAVGPMQAIRAHDRDAHITCLTTAPFAALARATGCFDDVWVDARPRVWNVPGWLRLRARLRGGDFTRVYDLQTSRRSSGYFRLMGGLLARPKVEWSGIAKGCSHPHANPRRDLMHTIERQAEQLEAAGIAAVAPADLWFLRADVKHFALEPPYALLVPGGASHRPEKRWPVSAYGRLARLLAGRGVTPVVIGAEAERDAAQAIASACPSARDLTGATSLAEVAELARGAEAGVGNDTGPMHVIAAVGCPAVVLFSAASDPALCAPRAGKGGAVTVLRRLDLSDLTAEEVEGALFGMRGRSGRA